MTNRTSRGPEGDNQGSIKDLQLFGNVEWGIREFDDQPVLTATVDGVLHFENVGLCKLLRHSNPSKALADWTRRDQRISLDVRPANSLTGWEGYRRGNPNRAFVTRAGANRLLLKSDAPGGDRVREWLADDVMPSIEDTGGYQVPPGASSALDVTSLNGLKQLHEAFGLALARIEEQALQLKIERSGRAAAEEEIAALEGPAAQAHHHRAAEGHMTVGDLANKLKAWAVDECNVKVYHDDVWDFCRELGLIIKNRNTVRKNRVTSFALDNGYMREKDSEHEGKDGRLFTNHSPRVTPKGEGYIWDRATKRIANTGTLKKQPKGSTK